jgi:hypothetical protein
VILERPKIGFCTRKNGKSYRKVQKIPRKDRSTDKRVLKLSTHESTKLKQQTSITSTKPYQIIPKYLESTIFFNKNI